MRLHPSLHVDHHQIEDFCSRWQVKKMALFGSVLRDDFRPDSDVDVLVEFSAKANWGFFALSTMEQELKVLFNRPVDVITRESVEESENYLRRRAILQSMLVIHAS